MADIEDAINAATVTTGRWILESTTPRDKARSQALWMTGRARQAAKHGRVDDARWWRDRAICDV
jgi:hypothetical protein